MRMWKYFLIVTLVFVLATAGAEAAVFYVKPGGTGGGSSWAKAGDLKDVLPVTASGAEVWVAAGIYSPGVNASDTFTLKKGVKVYGGFTGTETDLNQRNINANKTILDGGNVNYHVLTGDTGATPADTRLDGFTITKGKANGPNADDKNGGGMFNKNSSPAIANCTFSSNNADYGGGGIGNDGSSPSVRNCFFFGNNAKTGGGGMGNGNKSNPEVIECVFSSNQAESGGGVVNNSQSNPSIMRCVFTGNKASEYGGAMGNVMDSSPIITECAFTENTADQRGGAIYNWNWAGSSKPVFINCTFSGNKSETGGAVANLAKSESVIMNCTFSANESSKEGGALYNRNASLTTVNSIFWANKASAGRNFCNVVDDGKTTDFILKNCVVAAQDSITNIITGTGKLNRDEEYFFNQDPELEALDSAGKPTAVPADIRIYALKKGSSAIDNGLAAGTIIGTAKVPDKDQLGVLRPKGNGVDIGSFESDHPTGGGGTGNSGGGGCNAGWAACVLFALAPFSARKQR